MILIRRATPEELSALVISEISFDRLLSNSPESNSPDGLCKDTVKEFKEERELLEGGYCPVHFNKKAFVRSNPNYLYSGKQLYLPSINEIKGLIIKKNKNQDENQNKSPLSSQIYFFGG